MLNMLLYLLISIVCLILCLVHRYTEKRNNKFIATINVVSLLEIGIFRINLRDVFQRIVFMGERTNENGGVSKFFCGPLVAYVPVWKQNRRIVDIAMKQNIIDGYIDLFNSQGKRLAEAMAEGLDKDFDYSEIITKNTLETVCQTTMGVNVNGQDLTTESYVKAINKVLEIMTQRVVYPWLMSDHIFNWSSLKKEQDKNLKIIWNLSDQMVKLRKSEYKARIRNENKDKFDDFEINFRSVLDVFIENTVSEDHEQLSDLRLRNIVDNFLLGGFDTTAPELLYILINIGSYPDVQRKVYEEIFSIIGDKEAPISKHDLKRLVYLEAVVKETIRLYPVGAVVGRTTTSEVQLKNYVLPADCHVILHLWALNRNKRYWGEDADAFRPERWLEDSVPSPPSAFASFSLGKRNCPGKSYGMILMKITIAHIVRKYKILADDKKLQFEFAIMLKPYSGQLIKLKKRLKNVK